MTNPDPLANQTRVIGTGSAWWMIQRLAARLNGAMREKLSALDLKQDQVIVLMALAEMQGASQTEIGARTGLANYTVTRALDALDARGLTQRKPDERSRRAHRVFLTASGEALMPDLFDLVAEVYATFLNPLPEGERARFLASLSHLCGDAGAGRD